MFRTLYHLISIPTANLPSLPVFKKNFELFKKTDFLEFKKFYYFSHILRQSSYNFVIKNIQIQFRTFDWILSIGK